MRAAVPLAFGIMACCAGVGILRADAGIEGTVIEEGRVVLRGTVDAGQDVVLRIEAGKKPLEWRNSGIGGGFEAVLEASDKLSLEGGKRGHGLVMTVNRGKARDITNISFTDGDPISGRFTVRPKADVVTKDGVVTFADVTQPGGRKLPVSLHIQRAK